MKAKLQAAWSAFLSAWETKAPPAMPRPVPTQGEARRHLADAIKRHDTRAIHDARRVLAAAVNYDLSKEANLSRILGVFQ